MSLPTSALAYHDCQELLERAKDDLVGIRVRQPSEDAANYLRMRIHQCRVINRRDNGQTYPKGHPLHYRSEWDDIVCRYETDDSGQVWLYLQRHQSKIDLAEPLSGLSPEYVEHQPQQALPAPEPTLIDDFTGQPLTPEPVEAVAEENPQIIRRRSL